MIKHFKDSQQTIINLNHYIFNSCNTEGLTLILGLVNMLSSEMKLLVFILDYRSEDENSEEDFKDMLKERDEVLAYFEERARRSNELQGIVSKELNDTLASLKKES